MSAPGSNGSLPSDSNGDRSSDLLELADALMERARTLASQSDQLIAVLDDTARRLIESGYGVEASPLPAPVKLLKPQPAEAHGPGDPSVSEGARLLINRLTVAGRGHDEIAERLREDFGIADADQVLERAGL